VRVPAVIRRHLSHRSRRRIRTLRGIAHGAVLRGNGVTCVVCGGRFRHLLPYDGRPGARCPRCESLERHRRAVGHWRDRLDLFDTPRRVLHIAPEPGLERLLRRADNLDYVTGDLEPGHADRVVDLTAMAEADGSYDVVICSHVLEHVGDDVAAMREIARVLRPGGVAYLVVPHDPAGRAVYEDPTITSPSARRAAFGREDHVRLYSAAGFEERLRGAGLDVEDVPTGPGDEQPDPPDKTVLARPGRTR
jgi:SAM-dependent methyltransferase